MQVDPWSRQTNCAATRHTGDVTEIERFQQIMKSRKVGRQTVQLQLRIRKKSQIFQEFRVDLDNTLFNTWRWRATLWYANWILIMGFSFKIILYKWRKLTSWSHIFLTRNDHHLLIIFNQETCLGYSHFNLWENVFNCAKRFPRNNFNESPTILFRRRTIT